MPAAMAALGHADAWSGRTEEGVSRLQEALTAYESAGFGFHHSLCVEHLGEAHCLQARSRTPAPAPTAP